MSNPSDMTARTHTYEHAARLAEDAERLSSVCSLRPFSQDEAEEAVNVLLEIPALLSDLADAREALARREWQFVHANGKLTDCADEEEALQMARVAGGWIRWRTIWQTTAVGGGGQGTQEKSRMTLPDANPSNDPEVKRLRLVLERIAENAEDWHGPPPDMGHVRALKVIATWARAALAESNPSYRSAL